MYILWGFTAGHVDVAYSSGNFTSDSEQGMSIEDVTIPDDDIFARCVKPPCVLVTAGFDDYCIISLVELTVLNQKIPAHFQIDSVIVVSMCLHIEMTYYTAVTQIEVDGPKRTLADVKIF